MKNLSNVSIKVKIAGAVVGCLVVIAVANAVMARYNYEQDMRYAADLAVKAAAQAFVSIEKREVDKLSTTLDALIGEPAFAAFFALRDRDHLLETAAPVFKELRTRHNVTRSVERRVGKECR